MIVGIESSCDESAVALFDGALGIIHEEIASQIDLHGAYGGVVPELAAREHVKNFIPLFENLKNFDVGGVRLVAVTGSPGLPGCVNIGIAAAKALALIFGTPVVGINHLHGHLFSPFIGIHEDDPGHFFANLTSHLPHIGLLASGGNTILFKISEGMEITTVAETQDDAAGEAFDKGAKLLGLPYPGGALVEKFAELGNGEKYPFPRAFADPDTMKFSFSGLKTSLRYFLEKFDGDVREHMGDICASYQAAIVGALATKVGHAIVKFPDCKSLGISGGVSNNGFLRNAIRALAEKFGKKFLSPLRRHSGDNAAMIAFAAHIANAFPGMAQPL
ncbi:MAG: tRNA (adenosine(37)-N6)-threonylcarbamoyltransferase complex transferase subunit TsaD [Puniceicoccales bacterium]|jgi:N6-L-threonylcarbamoyladenine synthase|nr:tRNA (adenosine(37)-N6)-threonylcarbamoyltransferase complex transferase subunit TsaD [Puniceicoccales bacterium]